MAQCRSLTLYHSSVGTNNKRRSFVAVLFATCPSHRRGTPAPPSPLASQAVTDRSCELRLRLTLGVSNPYIWEYHVSKGNVIDSPRDRHRADLRARLLPVRANAARYRSVDREYHLLTGKDAYGSISCLKNIVRDSVPNVNMPILCYFG